MLSNFSIVLIVSISSTAVINSGGLGKSIGGIQKAGTIQITILL